MWKETSLLFSVNILGWKEKYNNFTEEQYTYLLKRLQTRRSLNIFISRKINTVKAYILFVSNVLIWRSSIRMHFPYCVHFLFARSWKPVMCIESQYQTWRLVDTDLLLAFVAWIIHLTIFCISIGIKTWNMVSVNWKI